MENSKRQDKVNKKRSGKEEEFPVRTYRPRNSPLTDLLAENRHLKSIYYLGVAILINTIMFKIATDYAYEGRVNFRPKIGKTAFKNFSWAVFTWACIFLSSLGVYYCLMLWAKMRKVFLTQRKLWDLVWLTLFLVHRVALTYFAAKSVTLYDLGIASAIVVLMETTRLLMKTHAFVRSNCPKYLQDTEETLNPTFSHYLYFLFAPVLVYKDTYPRSNNPIRWKLVGVGVLEFSLIWVFITIVFEKTFAFGLSDYGIKIYNWKHIMACVFQHSCTALIILVSVFYSCGQVYLNTTSELLGFLDRLFYEEWWIASTPERLLKKWNLVVYDWLYTYIYKDFYENVRQNKTLAKFMVFLLSAIFHDYIVCVCVRCFIPVFTVVFSIMLLFFCIRLKNKHVFSVLVWTGFGLVISLGITIVCMEYYAQLNCPSENESLYNIIIPRFLYC